MKISNSLILLSAVPNDSQYASKHLGSTGTSIHHHLDLLNSKGSVG